MVLKLFRGGTRVAERDVLFAVGLALGADVAETDRMLLLNGMLPLDDWDVRDHVIAAGICQGVDSETVNRWLEFAGVPLLKFERSCERPENEGETDSPGLSETAGGMPYDASGNGDYGDAPESPFYVIDEPPLV